MRDVELKRLLKDEGIGTYKFKKISLRLKPGAVPILAMAMASTNRVQKQKKERVKYIRREWCDSVG